MDTTIERKKKTQVYHLNPKQ